MSHEEKWKAFESAGLVRATFVEDQHHNFEDLCGDCYKFEVNPEIPHAETRVMLSGEDAKKELARQKRNFRAEVYRKGVWGYVSEFYNGTEWIDVDSCWGFVGKDAHEYARDIQGGAIDALEKWSKTESGKKHLSNLSDAIKALA